MRKFALPIGVGVVVFGVVTAFAASLTVNTSTLGAGNATVASCNSSATVSYNTALQTDNTNGHAGKYIVTTAPVTTAVACKGLAYKVTLLDSSNASLAEKTGNLDATTGDGSLDFTTDDILAHDVAGIAVVITG